MKSSTINWLIVGGLAWYLWKQHEQTQIVGPLQSQGGSAQSGVTMAPCAPGWYIGTDFSGNQTCLPYDAVS